MLRNESRVLVVLLFAIGCGGNEQDAPNPIDEGRVLGLLEGRGYVAEGFYRVNRVPYETPTAGSPINVWVSEWGVAGFASVAPEDASSPGDVPEGTIIVREVLDADSHVTKLTVMVKGPPGYSPGGGDFWFGVTDADGVPALDADGAPLLGRLEAQCGACHTTRSANGYMFGVPADNRRPAAKH